MTQPVDAKRRSYWLKTLHEWHWISSAVCLIGILLFSVTGITLNHSAQIEAKPVVATQKVQLPAELVSAIASEASEAKAPLPTSVRDWIAAQMDAGGDAWLNIDRSSGEIEYERTDRGWIAWLNDLHKGRNTGPAWNWFIDVFAIACVVFSLTGFFLLQLHARHRPLTWPLVGLGFMVMLLIAILFVH